MKTTKRKNIDSTVIKGVIILVLTVLLLIPVTMVQSLIEERASLKDAVAEEISSAWGGRQVLTGPILVVPYEKKTLITTTKNEKGEENYITSIGYAHFMPDNYNVNSEVKTEERSRSIYNVLVYQSDNNISGTFVFPKIEELGIAEESVKWDNAYMIIGIPYMQGIKNEIDFKINGKSYESTPGVKRNSVIASGLTVNIPLQELRNQDLNFSFYLNLNGSERFNVSTIGKQNTIKMNSNWGIVSFIGESFPQREIDKSGFTAEWNVFDYNRNQPQMWTITNESVVSVDERLSSVGVELMFSVDQYQMSMRSAKYAIMFILLTFAIFFLVEVITKTRIHPVQYTLVSFALILFYTLLIALSEHIGFQLAYLIAAIAIVMMITLYVKTIFKKWSYTLAMGGFVTLTYVYLYVILQLENIALLIGSVGLFITLAAIMFALRKVSWYKEEEVETEVFEE